MGSRVTEGGGGRRIKRAAMGWMISPCLQGYTLQLYHCRAGQWWCEGRASVGQWKGDTDRSSHQNELKKTETPLSGCDLHIQN